MECPLNFLPLSYQQQELLLKVIGIGIVLFFWGYLIYRHKKGWK